MNICYVSDSKYAPITAVSMLSLISKCEKDVHIHYLDTGLNNKDKKWIQLLVNAPNTIRFYECSALLCGLESLGFPKFLGNYSAYARLLMGEVLPDNIDRILYLDSDTLVVGSIEDMYNGFDKINLCEGVQDVIPPCYYTSVGIGSDHKYLNSGMLLIDFKTWKREFSKDNLKRIVPEYRNSRYPDQDIINKRKYDMYKILNGGVLGLRYNLTTPYLEWDYKYLSRIYPVMKGDFYSEDEVRDAVKNPTIVHLVDGFTERPWVEGSRSPFLNIWWDFLRRTEFYKSFRPFKQKGTRNHKIMKKIYMSTPQIISSSVYLWNIRRMGKKE